jgi:enamine deaminase RidA (YjgF/YER057c/UK114 family)
MTMSLEHLTPKGLFKPAVFTQVVVATGRRVVFISGQVSMDVEGNLVAEGDLAGQARQVYANLRAALDGAGVKVSDVAKLTTYVVGYRPDMLPVMGAARTAVLGTTDLPASTLVGVAALAQPGYLIEVEAVAVVD